MEAASDDRETCRATPRPLRRGIVMMGASTFAAACRPPRMPTNRVVIQVAGSLHAAAEIRGTRPAKHHARRHRHQLDVGQRAAAMAPFPVAPSHVNITCSAGAPHATGWDDAVDRRYPVQSTDGRMSEQRRRCVLLFLWAPGVPNHGPAHALARRRRRRRHAGLEFDTVQHQPRRRESTTLASALRIVSGG